MNGAALEVQSVWRRFGPLVALAGVDMTVQPGEIRALLGPNGAGKTTLLRILAGLLDPHQGTVRISGLPIENLGWRARRRLFTLVPSGERTFYMRLSGLENLIFFGRLHGLSLHAARTTAEECLDAVGLSDQARARVGTYSHGMQKRLSIARALLVEVPLMLIDEATQSLDPEGSRTTRELVKRASESGTAVVWTTQRVDEIRAFAHRVTVLNHGRVQFDGSIPELVALTPSQRYILHMEAALAASRPGSELPGDQGRLEVLDGSAAGHFRLTLTDSTTLGEAITSLVQAGWRLLACREEVSEVEEAFVMLTAEKNS